MRKFLFALLVALLIDASIAEAQKVTWSLLVSESSKLNYLKIIGQDENGFYLIRSNHPLSSGTEYFTYRNNRFLISCYDFNLHLSWEKNIDIAKKEVKIISFIVL